jgi:hypothetical protein
MMPYGGYCLGVTVGRTPYKGYAIGRQVCCF